MDEDDDVMAALRGGKSRKCGTCILFGPFRPITARIQPGFITSSSAVMRRQYFFGCLGVE